MSTATLVYDDHDSSISYSRGQWGQAGVVEDYKSTTTWTTQKGATASLTFSGTSVSVWGTISNVGNAPISSYSIDGGAGEIYNATISKIVQYQRPFFQSKQLTFASHTLVITILKEDAYFSLDCISVTPDVTASSSTSSTLAPPLFTSSTRAPSPTLSPHNVSSVSTTLLATTSPVDSSKDKVPLGLIIGGALGGLALLTFAFIGFLFLRRVSKDHSHERNPTSTNNVSLWVRVPRASGGITPFQPHLYRPLPGPGLYHSESVYKRPLVPVSTPSLTTLGTAPQSKLSQYNALSQGFQSRGASTSSSGALASTSTHQTSTSTVIPSDLPPPR